MLCCGQLIFDGTDQRQLVGKKKTEIDNIAEISTALRDTSCNFGLKYTVAY